MTKYLVSHFNLLIVDLPGMALNSRNKFIEEFKSIEDYKAYFIRTLHSLFGILKLSKFHLAGHSIGAYISAFYFDVHPEQVIKLYLLSPAGFNKFNEQTQKDFQNWLDKQGCIRKMIFKYTTNKVFVEKKSPMSYLIMPGYFIGKYLNARRFKFTEEEKELIKAIMVYYIK